MHRFSPLNSEQNVSVSPEEAGIAHFADDIARAGYSATSRLFRIQWTEPVHYELLERMIPAAKPIIKVP
jgi:uncharacterized protein YdhG (YjbR/CyaY superfamily)